ncbi:hypothetical protein GOP47_0015609 [Adiantum capillus-veneris]|uniref:Uncharacterized protein n=1 Tax=Adiantum capillus-veneris TaxID=13818 RepID=A0A9D4ZBD6_ADICA|nr:hypothetical protein GOP47_0015609 [Adiantum capillus-veneris]
MPVKEGEGEGGGGGGGGGGRRAELNCECLIRWCKEKKGTILVCGAVLLIAGLAIRRRQLAMRDAPPPLCSFHSSVSEETVLPSTSSETPMVMKNDNREVASTSKATQPLITYQHLKDLESCFQSENSGSWHGIIPNRVLPTLEYKLLGRSPKGRGPMQYLSTTRYKYYPDTNQIRDFMTDNDYKLKNDKLLKSFTVLDFDSDTGIETWHAIKAYPVIGSREYVLATKLWERVADQTHFCVTKACDHPKAPKPKHIVIKSYLSGWRISKAKEGRGCEMKIFHQEDEYIKKNLKPKAGANVVNFAEKI